MTKEFPAPPINGINIWLMEAAWFCRSNGMAATETVRKLESYDGTLRRPLQHREVIRAVERVFSATIDRSTLPPPKTKLPEWNATETARLYQAIGAAPQDLTAISVDRQPETYHPHSLLERLFPDPEGLVCIGESAYRFLTAPLSAHRRYREKQLIVPAYMTSEYGETADGRQSMHSKSNTGERRFIVCDFDDPPPEQHPSIIMHLMKFRPLVLALSSGGKSLHAWFPVSTSLEDDRLFWRLCIALGADPALYRNHSQFVRLPNGTRSNGAKQTLLYFNPSALP